MTTNIEKRRVRAACSVAAMPRASLLTVAATSLILTGCATTKIDNLAMTPTNASTPSMLLVDVDVSPDAGGTQQAHEAAGRLREKLLHYYRQAGLPVASAGTEGRRGSAAVLHVTVDHAKRGSKLKSFVIGFGAGSSQLRTSAVLDVPGTRGPALRFNSRTTANLRPGLMVPGGVAAATGETAGLPISAGLGLFSVSRTGLDRDVDRSAKRIVAETRAHYARVGWRWAS